MIHKTKLEVPTLETVQKNCQIKLADENLKKNKTCVKIFNMCKQKQGTSFFFTYNKECEQCISLFTLKLIVKFWQDIRNGYM